MGLVAIAVRARHGEGPLRSHLADREGVALALLHPGFVEGAERHLRALGPALDVGFGPGRLAPEEDGLVVVDLPGRRVLVHEPDVLVGTCRGRTLVDAAGRARPGLAEARLGLALLCARGRVSLASGPEGAPRRLIETPADIDVAAMRVRELGLGGAAVLVDLSPWIVERFSYDVGGALAMRDRLAALGLGPETGEGYGEEAAWSRWALMRGDAADTAGSEALLGADAIAAAA